MSKLNTFFDNKADAFRHPVLTFLENIPAENVKVDVVRPRDTLGFKAARIYLRILDGPPSEYAWDDELNAALVAKGIKAVSPESEKVRFALGLRFGFKRVELRFGDGFFNAVLGKVVREKFAGLPEIDDVLRDVHTDQPFMGGNGYENCRDMIEKVIGDRAMELIGLNYPMTQAEEILAGAMALYLDERFTVTDRRRLGWT